MGMEASSEIFGVDILNTHLEFYAIWGEYSQSSKRWNFWVKIYKTSDWTVKTGVSWAPKLGATGEVKMEIQISGISFCWLGFVFI